MPPESTSEVLDLFAMARHSAQHVVPPFLGGCPLSPVCSSYRAVHVGHLGSQPKEGSRVDFNPLRSPVQTGLSLFMWAEEKEVDEKHETCGKSQPQNGNPGKC